jgi:hypothetical protein
MFKHYRLGLTNTDKYYELLEEILVLLCGDETVQAILELPPVEGTLGLGG